MTFGLRPEHIGVGTAGDPSAAQVAGRVMLLEPLGSDTLGARSSSVPARTPVK